MTELPMSGCRDGACWSPPRGQHTNAGCRCFGAGSTRQKLRVAAEMVNAQHARIQALEEALRQALGEGEE